MPKSEFASDLIFLFTGFCLVMAALPTPAEAGYLDPGSGSSFMQGIVAALMAMRRFFSRIFSIFGARK